MNLAFQARALADYIQELNFVHVEVSDCNSYTHIGALYTNVILQAGLNYKNVVQPRVMRVLHQYPEANTITGFLATINKYGIEKVINWKHPTKIDRLYSLIEFSREMDIDNCQELSSFLSDEANQEEFLSIRGIGNKTLDYTLKLLAFDTVAVDRHIYSFIEQAGLTVIDYRTTKKVVEFAADLLNVPRSTMDNNIWHYMSEKNSHQATIQF